MGFDPHLGFYVRLRTPKHQVIVFAIEGKAGIAQAIRMLERMVADTGPPRQFH